MPKWKPNYYTRPNDAEKYLDMAITSIIELPKNMMEKEESFDVNKYLKMNRLLVEQLENIAIATGKIKPVKEIDSIDELTKPQKDIRKDLIEFFKKNNPDVKMGSVFMADRVMRFILEGEYPTRIELMAKKLENKVKEGKIVKEVADAQLTNYKLQLIIKNSTKTKARKVELHA